MSLTRMRRLSRALAATALLAAPVAGASSAPARASAADLDRRIDKVLSRTPVIDGHNDLPWQIRMQYDYWRKPVDLRTDTSRLPAPLHTDLARLKRGHVGGVFWSIYVPTDFQGPAGIQAGLEQVDIARRLTPATPRPSNLR